MFEKTDRIVYWVGVGAMLVAAGCLGWNMDHFTKKKD